MATDADKELVSTGAAILVEAFGACVQELFRKPVIISTEEPSPLSKAEPALKEAIVLSAAQMILAQQCAVVVIKSGGHVTENQINSVASVQLKATINQYVKQMQEVINAEKAKRSVGEGTNATDATASGQIHTP